ncbi:GNAT family N-acetyltransferase [Sphingomonas bacterium]|uniref:GNAT family N-acetyltransferase n=1 Tax=Sphingomonas bacterium TaxID=1895847 RepID=UPI0020C5F262|nr:GNAT family N-acetyltransferase [Sphingomonas bacterium]
MSARATPDLVIRAADRGEIPSLERLIASSARALGQGYYSDAETEAAIAHVFGVDSDLVDDGSYLVATDADGRLLGCGGWSRRRTLFGGDNFAGRTPGFLDPAEDAARIRAFFVAPGAARMGIASALLAECEQRAAAMGFTRMALMATLPGVPFYAARGYVEGETIRQQCGDVAVRFISMSKTMADTATRSAVRADSFFGEAMHRERAEPTG